MVKIIWTKRAFSDLRNIYQYISNDSELYAARLIDNLVLSVDILETFPLSGRMIPEKKDETLREIIFDNYRIFYKIVSLNKISIVRIHHSAKKIK